MTDLPAHHSVNGSDPLSAAKDLLSKVPETKQVPFYHNGVYHCRECDKEIGSEKAPCPTCTPQSKVEPALRFDAGKAALHHFDRYVDEGFCEEIGKVLAYGAIKYGPDNWKKGMSWSRCINSARRHLLAFTRGQKYDEESGCHHLALLFCSIMFLFVYERDSLGKDDR